MDLTIENKFVDKFVVNRLRERVKYELVSSQKRGKAIARFSQNICDTVEEKHVLVQDNKYDMDEVFNIISRNYRNPEPVYYMDEGGGEMLPIKEALSKTMSQYMTALLIINENYVFIKGEVEYGAPNKVFLKYSG